MTIVGLERMKDGSRNLILFDPSFPTSNAMIRLLRGRNGSVVPAAVLKAYRKSEDSLAKWREFEIMV